MRGNTYKGVFVLLLASAVSLCLFQVTSGLGIMYNCIFLFLAGAGSSGPDAVISGSLAAEIGMRENAQSAVSGLVNGEFFLCFFFLYTEGDLKGSQNFYRRAQYFLYKMLKCMKFLCNKMLLKTIKTCFWAVII